MNNIKKSLVILSLALVYVAGFAVVKPAPKPVTATPQTKAHSPAPAPAPHPVVTPQRPHK